LERRNWAQETIKHQTVATYTWVLIALAVLMGATIAAKFVDLGHGGNLIVALIIASIKATLVVMFFMNVKGGTRLITIWAALGFIWLLLMGGIFMDYRTRHWVEVPGWQWSPSNSQDPEYIRKQADKVGEPAGH
jgi:cytochrome c oxidase subunit 4